jgi:exodeoxyribonuclease VII large subunit
VATTPDISISQTALSVTQVARRINGALRNLGDGWVEGEVRSIKLHISGHVYLALADEDSNLEACIWKGRVGGCQPLPEQGDLVQAHYERVDFYTPRGSTKLIIDSIKHTGEGELLRRRAQTLARLQADGLCDAGRRKPVRAFPRRVGVVAAQGSDAMVDVIRHLRERFPAQDIVVCPASVQGVEAVGSVIDALACLQSVCGVDVIILARGGGSVADLVAFDDERLCRAIFACEVPIITSIGHTKDRPNCDHVAAAFAPVPAKAAERAIRYSVDELLDELARHSDTLASISASVRHRGERVSELWQQARPHQRITELATAVDRTGDLLASRTESSYRRREVALSEASRLLVAVALKLPRPVSLNDLHVKLHEAAVAFIGGHRDVIDASSVSLNGAARRIPGPVALDAFAAHVHNAGTRIREKCRDYGRALQRFAGDADRDLTRRLVAEQRVIAAEVNQLRPAADRVLARAHDRVSHFGALVDAKDFRRRGWVLASEQGRAVQTVAGLRVGTTLELRFADGEAAATVDDIKPHQQGEGS